MKQQQTFYALGSDVLLTVAHQRTAAYGDEAFAALKQRVAAFEQRFSRFLPDSELTRFNQQAGQKVMVSAAFRRLLRTAQNMAAATGGLYNPFVLPALQRAGYVGTWPQPATRNDATDFTERKVAAAKRIEVGDTWARIPADAAIDFGGIGKGYLLDELAATLQRWKLDGYWLSLGGDIICGGYDDGGTPWRIGVQHATQASSIVQTITNKTGAQLAIATSGTTKRHGIQAGRPWHHLIDPRTGQPARTAILTATVTAGHAVTADVYAKCIVIADSTWAEQAQEAGAIVSFVIQTEGEER